MKKEQEQVREFMLKAGQLCPKEPWRQLPDVMDLRDILIKEEAEEFAHAQTKGDIVEVADAIADLLVVVLGAAVAWGIDIDPIFQEVHKSNMTKFIDGHKRKDGKWIKGPSYIPPNIAPLIEAQAMAQQKP